MGTRLEARRMPRRRPDSRIALLSVAAAAVVATALVAAVVGPWQGEEAEVAVLHGPGQRNIASVAVFRGTGSRTAGTTATEQAAPAPAETGRFSLCAWPPHRDCVIDGDTFYLGGEAIRIADIDAPETHNPQCSREADLGAQATRRLLALLNDGAFTLMAPGTHGTDPHGRHLRTVLRGSRSIGAILVTEGLAEPWHGPTARWCG